MAKKKVLGLVTALILVIIALCCALLFRGNGQTTSDSNGGVTLDTNAVDFQTGGAAASDPLSIRFPGYNDITLQQEKTVIPIVLTNPEGNPCLFQFTVTMDGSEQVLLSSNWVEPGKALEGVTLPAPLDKGDHTLSIKIATRSLENQEPLNGSSVQVVIHVI